MNCASRRRVGFLTLILFLVGPFSSAFGKDRSAKLEESIDLPSTFDIDLKLASRERTEITGYVDTSSDDAAGRTGAEVFKNLVATQMISGFGLPYRWRFSVLSARAINAISLSDGGVAAYSGLSELMSTNRGLWAAVLSHEIAHVARRHSVRKFLYHEYIEQQIRYWQLRSYYGDKNATWAIVGLRVAGGIAEKKLSRDLEHDADVQGMLLMARAGYHPDYVFAMHHVLRMYSGEQSKFGAFFSGHPRWETRDQRSERAYADAVAEYNRLWPSAAASPGGAPPQVVFLGGIRSAEAKNTGTGDLVMSLSCRNAVGPVALVVRLTGDDGQPMRTLIPDYSDSSGNLVIRQYASCLDKDSATPTVLHIPTSVIPGQDRKLKAQVDFVGPDNQLLERSRNVDIRFPKPGKNTSMARVSVEPSSAETPGLAPGSAMAFRPTAPILDSSAAVTTSVPAVSALAPSSKTTETQAGLGIASVTSDPEKADIFVDSKGMGKTPQLLHLKAGRHSVQLVRQGYKDWTSSLDVKENSIVNVTAKLEPRLP